MHDPASEKSQQRRTWPRIGAKIRFAVLSRSNMQLKAHRVRVVKPSGERSPQGSSSAGGLLFVGLPEVGVSHMASSARESETREVSESSTH